MVGTVTAALTATTFAGQWLREVNQCCHVGWAVNFPHMN